MVLNTGKILNIRRLYKDEKVPYDLLLLADETLEAINLYINDSEIYISEQENRIIAIRVLQTIGNGIIEIKNIAVEAKYQGQGIGNFYCVMLPIEQKKKVFKQLLSEQQMQQQDN